MAKHSTLFRTLLLALLGGLLALSGCDQGGQGQAPQGQEREKVITNPDEGSPGAAQQAPGETGDRPGPMPPQRDEGAPAGGEKDPMGDSNP